MSTEITPEKIDNMPIFQLAKEIVMESPNLLGKGIVKTLNGAASAAVSVGSGISGVASNSIGSVAALRQRGNDSPSRESSRESQQPAREQVMVASVDSRHVSEGELGALIPLGPNAGGRSMQVG